MTHMMESENSIKITYFNYSPCVEERLNMSSRNIQYKDHMELLKMEITMCKMKISLDKVNSHLDNVEEKIGEHEGIATEIIQNETERKKA